MFHLQEVLRSLPDGLGYLIAIGASLLEDPQDHHVQSSLQNIHLPGFVHKKMISFYG